MESQASIGIGLLPEELMLLIVQQTSLQASASLWLASRFWHQKLNHMFAHPKILLVQWPERSVFMLNHGIGNRVVLDQGWDDGISVTHGWFETAAELSEFLSEFNRILVSNTAQAPKWAGSWFLKVEPKNSAPIFYTGTGLQGSIALDKNTANALEKLIESAKLMPPEKNEEDNTKDDENDDGDTNDDDDSDDDDSDGDYYADYDDVISLTVYAPKPKRVKGRKALPRPQLDLWVRPNGYVHLSTVISGKLRACKSIYYDVRTSPDVFTQLKEIMVYSKHTQSLEVLEERPYRADIYTLFDMECFVGEFLANGKVYSVQECTMQQDDQQVTLTNDYKTSSIKKIIKVLDSVLFNKSIEPIALGVPLPPPSFAGHQLIRLPHFRMPRDEHFSSVVSIHLHLKADLITDRRYCTEFRLDLNSDVPLAEILALFREVEQHLNGDDTECRELNFKPVKGVTIESVSVKSFKAVRSITYLPKPLILKVWHLLMRTAEGLAWKEKNKRPISVKKLS